MFHEHGKMSRVNSFIIFFSAFTFQQINADALESESIINGRLGSIKQFKYQVTLLLPKALCGGGIIHKEFVVSAAHCMYDENHNSLRKPIYVVGGIDNINTDIESPTKFTIPVSQYYIPMEYARNPQKFVADIAVLKLAKPMEIHSNLYLASLNLPNINNYAGKKATIAGFGWDQINIRFNFITDINEVVNGSTSGRLQFAKTQVIGKNDCQKIFTIPRRWLPKKLLKVENSFICAQSFPQSTDGPHGVCRGDSGSPLVHGTDTLIGVLAFGDSMCDETDKPAIYTKVLSYKKFIENSMKNNIDGSKIYAVDLKNVYHNV